MGDIHGGLKALLQVFERVNYNPEKDKLIMLGDYVDGWSESSEVIEYIIKLKKNNNPDNIITLLGNHDDWCKNWLLLGQAPNHWVSQGGQSTIDSYIKTGYIAEESHKKFFKECKLFYIDEQNRGFVHGGYVSRKGLGHEVYNANYYWDRDLWNLALMSHGRKHEEANLVKDGMSNGTRFERHKEVFIGHTSTLNWNYKHNGVLRIQNENQKVGQKIMTPINACNVWNMDTGGGFGGKLTIMDIDTKEYWQSDLVGSLYPDETGRG